METILCQPPDFVANLVGYSAAIIVPGPALLWIAWFYWEIVALDAGFSRKEMRQTRRIDIPAIIGVIERFLYVASLLVGAPELIGVWLILKVAGGWQGWSAGRKPRGQEDDATAPHVYGRQVFNIFLLGSGLSLVWAVAGWASIVWIATHQVTLAVVALSALTLGTYAFAGVLYLVRCAKFKKRAA